MSIELRPAEATHIMSLIGMMMCMVEFGQVDICLECSMMSSCSALPREGHLHQVFHMFAYLNKYNNINMVYDLSDLVVEELVFKIRIVPY